MVTAAAEALAGTLAPHVHEALRRAADRRRPVLASATVELGSGIDPAAIVFASRRADERWFAWEQPDRDGFALAALGAAHVVESAPARDRFRGAARDCSELVREAVVGEAPDRLATGPVWVGGFSFFPEGGAGSHWASLPATLLVLPELALARSGDETALTVNVVCRPGDGAGALIDRAVGRVASLRDVGLPLVDPDPAGGYDIASVLPPQEYERAVEAAARHVRARDVDKLVLAREVQVAGARPFNPGAVFAALRSGYASCYCFCVGTPEAAFLGASPELLVRRAGAVVSTVALAGSARRSADPAVDDHLGERLLHSPKDLDEHRIVVGTVRRSLEPLSVWVTAAEEPVLVKVANIQHLATPVRAQLAHPRSAIELAGALHPTSAVGGEPWAAAEPLVRDLERMDRGWYAAPVGWMDAAEDGELCVALRCALVQGATAHCYAGGGVVADSDPEAELAETEVKLQAIVPALTGA
jgi:salicylate biosynthesis isochorismate synthase/menaquinone-specific isochorismate synthase